MAGEGDSSVAWLLSTGWRAGAGTCGGVLQGLHTGFIPLASGGDGAVTATVFMEFSYRFLALSVYLSILLLLTTILILACALFSQVFCMMYSAYKLNKEGDNIQL